MENVAPKGLLLVNETSDEVSAVPLMLSTMKRLSQQSFDIVAILNFSSKKRIQERFTKVGLSSVTTLKLPNIDQISAFFSEIPSKLAHLQKPVLYLENLNVYLSILGVDPTIRLLNLLAAQFPIYTVIKGENLKELTENRLNFVANAVLKLRTEKKSTKNLCETTLSKKDGAVKSYLEEYTIDPQTFTIDSKKYSPEKIDYTEPSVPETSSQLPKTTFDMGLNLREDEAEAKKSTKLPFLNAQNEKGLVNLNINTGKKVRAGGQIIYTPDRDDDLDDSDPDDDLMI
ncbi:unnamed protein product [Bursaphelenchus okinawaensis]|uniref:Elongator complex protein 5 n=1 Tax=Bursaphelenchus okinawaensis TaxID=465554 RepID=A0A811L5R1_9BILA|nr:unnamed protein product [Bursaphelenchus okinawaensis]CAG9117154.1 unnamed protein product [Bursaphelenchus okinawaensis]